MLTNRDVWETPQRQNPERRTEKLPTLPVLCLPYSDCLCLEHPSPILKLTYYSLCLSAPQLIQGFWHYFIKVIKINKARDRVNKNTYIRYLFTKKRGVVTISKYKTTDLEYFPKFCTIPVLNTDKWWSSWRPRDKRILKHWIITKFIKVVVYLTIIYSDADEKWQYINGMTTL